MTTVNRDNDMDETDTTEAEFDAMWAEASHPPRRVQTQFGTLHLTYGPTASGTARRGPGTHLQVTGAVPEAVPAQ